MKVFIIGGTNFIGLHTAIHFTKQGHDVTLYHRNSNTRLSDDNILHIYGDKTSTIDLDYAITTVNPDVIIHMIALSEDDVIALHQALRKKTKVILISSGDVYKGYEILTKMSEDEIETAPFTESSPLRQQLYPYRNRYEFDFAYNYEKILVEKAALASEKMEAIILRLGMVYGVYDGNHRFAEFIHNMKSQKEVSICKDYASWSSSMVYVENVAHAVLLSALEAKSGSIYNVAEKSPVPTVEWVRRIATMVDYDGKINIISPKEESSTNYLQNLTLNTDKIRKELGYSEIVPLEHGLNTTINWELEQMK